MAGSGPPERCREGTAWILGSAQFASLLLRPRMTKVLVLPPIANVPAAFCERRGGVSLSATETFRGSSALATFSQPLFLGHPRAEQERSKLCRPKGATSPLPESVQSLHHRLPSLFSVCGQKSAAHSGASASLDQASRRKHVVPLRSCG